MKVPVSNCPIASYHFTLRSFLALFFPPQKISHTENTGEALLVLKQDARGWQHIPRPDRTAGNNRLGVVSAVHSQPPAFYRRFFFFNTLFFFLPVDQWTSLEIS